MSRVFISHAAQDAEFIETYIMPVLAEAGHEMAFSTYDLHSGNWVDWIATEIERCDRLLVALSSNALNSWWVRSEVNHWMRKRQGAGIVPVMIAPCDPDRLFPNLGSYHGPRFDRDPVPVAQAELRRVFRAGSPGASTASETRRESPYVGLYEFTESKARFFFGRRLLSEKLEKMVRARQVVAVIGSSGSGKSSLIQAGLFPRLRPDGWIPLIFRPDAFPFITLGNAIRSVREPPLAGAPCTQAPDLRDRLEAEGGLFGLVDEWLSYVPQAKVILFINQFEEIFTLCKDSRMRGAFLRALQNLPHKDRFRLVFAVRSDYYYQTIEESDGSAWIGNTLPVRPMDAAETKLAIREPAVLQEVGVEDALVARILADSGIREGSGGADGTLPLLQFCLAELWARRTGETLTLEAYEGMGGLRGCIVRRANDEYENLTPAQQKIALELLPHLVNIAENARIRLTLEELCRRSRVSVYTALPIIETFQGARLLVMDGDPDISSRYVEFSHEAVFRNWGPLEELLARNRSYLLWRQDLRMRVNAWRADSKNQRGLLAEGLLDEARKWLREYSESTLDADEQEFIQLSEHQQRAKEEGIARAQVENLLTTKLDAVPELIESLRSRPELLRAKLDERRHLPPEQEWRLRLALVADDLRHVSWLADYVYQTDPWELLLIRAALRPYQHDLIAPYRAAARDEREDPEKRFRAACMLAEFDPDGDQWAFISRFVAAQLIQDVARFLRAWIEALFPARHHLRDHLRPLCQDLGQRETVRQAAFALGEFDSGHAGRLADYACEAAAGAYEELYGRLQAAQDDRDNVVARLREVLDHDPEPGAIERERQCLARQGNGGDADQAHGVTREEARAELGKRRAGAAITLIRLGEYSAPLAVFQVHQDPESLTQFAARVSTRGVKPAELLDCLEHATAPLARYGIMLSLGEYRLAEIPPFRDQPIEYWVRHWFWHDPSSAIHGACGWLLRNWHVNPGPGPVPPPPAARSGREWFSHRVADESFSMIVYPPGDFVMGSPEEEHWRSRDEDPAHMVHLTRSFALADVGVTRGLYELFLDATGRDKTFFNSPDGFSRHETTPRPSLPVSGLTWDDAVAFCRWLTIEIGLAEDDQCYSAEGSRPGEGYSFRPERRGFRLPTEAEREYACRCGTTTMYSFGSDWNLLNRYGWFMENAARWPREVGRLRPDLRGLFDTHGNIFEWCNDWYGPYSEGSASDPLGPAQPGRNRNRALRGGGWYSHAYDCRSAARNLYPGEKYFLLVGFRLACGLAE